jgi:ubiquinone/menaquinone biosynthesis C-methylase UbiE
MRREIAVILDGLNLEADGIYSSVLPTAVQQADEIRDRARVAQQTSGDLLVEIGRHHSIPVMEEEIRRFLRGVRADGVVADIGGGWGWHWRRLDAERPDLCVVVVDFVRENLRQAAGLLGAMVNRQIFLVHGDATALPFPSSVFDGYWSVQTLQHIPNVEAPLVEARRVLRPGGQFASYSLNRERLIELAYGLLGKPYHVHGKRPDSFWLSRGSDAEARTVARVFGSSVTSRYTEVLFHPDLRLSTGGASSRIGRIDARLSSATPMLAWVARQRSYHTLKPAARDERY